MEFAYKRKFIFGDAAKDVVLKTSNEEAAAIENLMCRYSYAIAFYMENDVLAKSMLNTFLIIPGEEKLKLTPDTVS